MDIVSCNFSLISSWEFYTFSNNFYTYYEGYIPENVILSHWYYNLCFTLIHLYIYKNEGHCSLKNCALQITGIGSSSKRCSFMSLRFSAQLTKHATCEESHFYFFFPNWVPSISFSSLVPLASISGMMKRRKSGTLDL